MKKMRDKLTGEVISAGKEISIDLDGKTHVFSSNTNLLLWMSSKRKLIRNAKQEVFRNGNIIIHNEMRKKFGRTDLPISICDGKNKISFRNETELSAYLTKELEQSPLG